MIKLHNYFNEITFLASIDTNAPQVHETNAAQDQKYKLIFDHFQ